MTAAVAGIAGVLAVLALWDAFGAIEGGRALAAVTGALAPAGAAGRGGLQPTRLERRRLALTGSAVLAAAGWLVAGPAGALALGTLGPLAGALYVRGRRARWRRDLQAGAPAGARAIADALAGGHGVSASLAIAARDGAVAGAAREALAGVGRQIALGTPVPAALAGLQSRAGEGPWDSILAAVLLQREAGGDLAGLLRDLAEGLAVAARVEADARAASAQARLTARIVLALPVLGAVVVGLAAPQALAAIARDPLARLMAFAALALQLVAVLAVRRIARVGAG